MTVRFKQIIAVGNEKQVETTKTVTAVSQELVFDFTDQIATSGIDLTQVQEIHVDLSNGWEQGYIGTVIFEDMTIGSVANNTPVITSSELKVYPTMVETII